MAPTLLAAIGCLALAVGLLVYVIDRDPTRAMLFPARAALDTGPMFALLGQWLPSFVHPFAFSLFTAAALPPRPILQHGACAAWCAVNLAFEVGQHPLVSAPLVEAVEASFAPTLVTQALASYFLRGTFDGGDIVGVILGSLAAAGVLWLTRLRQENASAQ